MRRKICYVLLIVISIVGSRLIFGKDYHLNSNSLKDENLYVYDAFTNNKVLSTYVDNEDFYYVVKNNSKQYTVVKLNLISDKKEEEYSFNSNDELENVSLFKQNGYIYLISSNIAH